MHALISNSFHNSLKIDKVLWKHGRVATEEFILAFNWCKLEFLLMNHIYLVGKSACMCVAVAWKSIKLQNAFLLINLAVWNKFFITSYTNWYCIKNLLNKVREKIIYLHNLSICSFVFRCVYMKSEKCEHLLLLALNWNNLLVFFISFILSVFYFI